MITIRRIASIQEAEFWDRVHKEDGCWKWTGRFDTSGYGVIGRYDGDYVQRSHRRAWEMVTGDLLTSHDTICHTCDVPACVRNDEIGTYRVGPNEYPRRGHLYKATQPVNVADRDAKERGNWAHGDDHGTHKHPETLRRGESHGNATLTDEMVRSIRATYTGRYGELASLARLYSVSTTAIRRAAIDNTWQHVTGTSAPILVAAPLPKARGASHSQARLTDTQVLQIRARAASGERQRALAAEYGMSTAMLSLIVNRKAWTHI